MSTQSVELGYEDHCECGDMERRGYCDLFWPCYRETSYRIDGDLADKVRLRLNAPTFSTVVLIEKEHVSGYSEYTITSGWLRFSISCAGHLVEFGEHDEDGYGERQDYRAEGATQGIAALLAWLDDTPTPPA